MLAARIVDRYLLAECVKTWLAVIIVLTVLTLGIGFARFIGEAAAGELPASTVFTVAAFSALENMEIVLPVSLLLAIMLTVGRLCRDNEMAALSAGGVGLLRFYRPFLIFALLVAVTAGWLSLSVVPRTSSMLSALSREFGVAGQLQALGPGRFHTLLNGRAAFYAGSVDRVSGEFRDVFIRALDATREQPAREIVVVAHSAVQQSDPDSGRQTLVLRDGWRYEGVPGQANYRVIRFAEHGVNINPAAVASQDDVAQWSNARLWADHSLAARAELQRRVGIPISVFLLALLALPLGHLPPRAGRYGKLVIGVLLYLGYANGLRLAQVWFEQGRSPAVLGLWWLHGLMLVFAVGLIARREGYFAFLPASFSAQRAA